MTHQALSFDSIRRDFLRRNKEEVQLRDDAYDYQIALNEAQCPEEIAQTIAANGGGANGGMWWRGAADSNHHNMDAAAAGGGGGGGGSAVRTKNVTETWDEYAVRTANKDVALSHYFAEQKAVKDAAAIRAQNTTSKSLAVVKALTEKDTLRKLKTLRPVGHTLLVDFAGREAKVMHRERALLESVESDTRQTTTIPEERSERKVIEISAAKSLSEVLAFLEKQRAAKKAEEERILAEKKRKEDEARAAEEKRRQEAEAAERHRRELEEEAKKAERKRREDERKAKAKQEREVRQKQRAAATTTTSESAASS